MDIAIATFHNSANYGAVLQAFALQTFLRQSGHSPFFIDHHFGRAPRGLRKYLARTPNGTLAQWAACWRRGAFAHFLREHLTVSAATYHNDEDLSGHPPIADVYICGSDQIWNPNFLRNQRDEQLFFLAFGPERVRRIAYAASFGVSSLTPEWACRIERYLQGFNFVSAREKDATAMLTHLGRKDTVWVPDPTLLLPAELYEKSLHLATKEQNVIFSYMLDKGVTELVSRTRQYVCNCLALPYIETYERKFLRIFASGVPDPIQWLSLLKTSRFVVTNSFHGTVFSLLFRRPFIVLPIEGKSAGMNGRITSLLERVGLVDRFVMRFDENQIAALCANSINWDFVGERIRDFAAIGWAFLAKALSATDKPPTIQAFPVSGPAEPRYDTHE